MRILFLDQFSDLGGAQQCLLDLLPAIRDEGWSAHVAAPGDGQLAARAVTLGATFEQLPLGNYRSGPKPWTDAVRFVWQTPSLARRINKFAEGTQADLIYVNGPRLLPAAAIAAAASTPVLFHCHNHLPQRAAAIAAGRALRRANATVVGCCRFAIEPIADYVSEERLHVVENGVVEAPERAGASNMRIGMIGRISPEKGQIEFLQAARQVVKAFPNYRFVIAGDVLFDDARADSYHQRVRAEAEGLSVQFLGWRDDVYDVMQQLDILVVPSIQEPGMPRVVLEAQSCGVPIIAFATGGIPEAITDGETGFLINPPTANELAVKLLALLMRSPDQLAVVGQAGRRAWRQRFTLERFRRQMLEYIRAAAGQPTHDGPQRGND